MASDHLPIYWQTVNALSISPAVICHEVRLKTDPMYRAHNVISRAWQRLSRLLGTDLV